MLCVSSVRREVANYLPLTSTDRLTDPFTYVYLVLVLGVSYRVSAGVWGLCYALMVPLVRNSHSLPVHRLLAPGPPALGGAPACGLLGWLGAGWALGCL